MAMQFWQRLDVSPRKKPWVRSRSAFLRKVPRKSPSQLCIQVIFQLRHLPAARYNDFLLLFPNGWYRLPHIYDLAQDLPQCPHEQPLRSFHFYHIPLNITFFHFLPANI